MSSSHLTVKEWSEQDQPREKLEHLGASALSDAELLAILVRTGTAKMNVLDCCKQLLADNKNDLNAISKLTVSQLARYEGIGKVKAVTLLAAIELGKRRSLQDRGQNSIISDAEDAVAVLQPILADLEHEEVWVLLLNRRNQVTDKKRVSQGGITHTVADIRIIMRHAIEAQATALILAHNHPSGAAFPSKEDEQLTQKVKEACKTLDINFLDHIIIARNQSYSFANSGIV